MSDAKALNNTSIADVQATTSDLVVFGNGDTWKLLCKVSSKEQGFMKSTKALEVEGVGCVLQTTTEFRNRVDAVTNCTDSVVFVPGVTVIDDLDNETGKVIGRHLQSLDI